MNGVELERVVDDLQRLVGQPFGNLWQPSRDRVVLGLSDGTFLLMVPRGPDARVHTVRGRPRNPPRPYSFQGACRSRLAGPLTAITKQPGERVVRLSFGRRHLELRLTGRSGGLWLLDGDEVVAAYDGPAPEALPALPERPPHEERLRFEPREGQTWSEAAERFFGEVERARRTEERRKRVARELRKAEERARRLLDNLEEDLEKADEAPALRHKADLLAAHLHEVRPGSDQVCLRDWETGDEVWVPLDPSKTPAASLEHLYGRARRLDRVGERVLERLEETEREVERLREALGEIDDAGAEELDALEALLPAAPERRYSAGRGADAPWYEWVGPRGERVLVGRNEKGNRRLTFGVARGDDVWMHLRERPGAHVLVPVPRGKTAPLELLLTAAQIVLAHAKVPQGASADVQYTQSRNVRAIPGETARVRLASEKVLHVTRDPAALVGWTRL